jgi:hypothetical protein
MNWFGLGVDSYIGYVSFYSVRGRDIIVSFLESMRDFKHHTSHRGHNNTAGYRDILLYQISTALTPADIKQI